MPMYTFKCRTCGLEQEEMRREQKLIQKEMERRAKFDNINNTDSSLSQLEKFSIDKSKKN